jgi:SAM-dependent methyltransferase
MTPADLTVIIPTRDRWPVLHRTLAALRAQTVQGFEVVVVVDGEDQAVPALPGVRVVQVPHGGPGAARNAGVDTATTPLLLLLGDDMIPRPGLVAAHLAQHAQRTGVEDAVLGHVDWHNEVPRTPLRDWIDARGMQFDYRSMVGDDAGWSRFYSCNVSLKRALFNAVGGFDPDFTYYYEDLDAGWRLGQHGMRLRYEATAAADHLHAYEEAKYATRMRGVAAGERMMAAKHPWFQPWFAQRFGAVEPLEPPHPLWRRLPTLPVKALQHRTSHAWTSRFAPDFLDAYEGAEELEELKAYLGADYDEARLQGHQRLVDAEEHEAPDELTFYRTSQAYLYDLTVFAMSGTKRPYRRQVRRLAPAGGRVLDYGCGIGSDGLRLMKAGLQVEFADFANPSVDYLRWRLDRRGLDAAIHDVEKGVPGGFDVVYCFDVIEHVDDPFGFLGLLEERADLVVVNFLEPTPDDVHVHKPLDVPSLLDHVVRQGLVSYRKHYGRSHLVAYRPGAARRTDQATARAKIARDRLRQPRARA